LLRTFSARFTIVNTRDGSGTSSTEEIGPWYKTGLLLPKEARMSRLLHLPFRHPLIRLKWRVGSAGGHAWLPQQCSRTAERTLVLLASRRRGDPLLPRNQSFPDLLFAFEADIGFSVARISSTGSNIGGSSGGESALIAACGSPFGLGTTQREAYGPAQTGYATIKPTSDGWPRQVTFHLPEGGSK